MKENELSLDLTLYTVEAARSKASALSEVQEPDPETQEEGERRIRTSSLIAFPANAAEEDETTDVHSP